jgi:hypothetical protein
MQPGDVVDVPFGNFHGFDLQSSIGAWAVELTGAPRSFMTTVNKKTKVVEVLRLK